MNAPTQSQLIELLTVVYPEPMEALSRLKGQFLLALKGAELILDIHEPPLSREEKTEFLSSDECQEALRIFAPELRAFDDGDACHTGKGPLDHAVFLMGACSYGRTRYNFRSLLEDGFTRKLAELNAGTAGSGYAPALIEDSVHAFFEARRKELDQFTAALWATQDIPELAELFRIKQGDHSFFAYLPTLLPAKDVKRLGAHSDLFSRQYLNVFPASLLLFAVINPHQFEIKPQYIFDTGFNSCQHLLFCCVRESLAQQNSPSDPSSLEQQVFQYVMQSVQNDAVAFLSDPEILLNLKTAIDDVNGLALYKNIDPQVVDRLLEQMKTTARVALETQAYGEHTSLELTEEAQPQHLPPKRSPRL